MENLKQKNEVLIQITNLSLYNETVNEIDTTGLISRGYSSKPIGFEGDLSIELCKDGFFKTISGEFGTKHYEDEWGFIFISKWEIEQKLADLKKEKKKLKIQIEDLKDLL